MVSKYTFLLFLIFIVHSNNAMEKNKKTWSFSQILSNFLQMCETERALWRQGYISHTQQMDIKQSIPSQTNSTAPSIQKRFTEQDIQIYLLTQ